MCATALRSFNEWDTHPHARALLGAAPVTITKIGEAPKRLVVPGNYLRPLDGIRVIDIGRVLAEDIPTAAHSPKGEWRHSVTE